MTITEAKNRIAELRKQISEHEKGYWGSEGYIKRVGEEERRPLKDEIEKLVRGIYKAEDVTEIKI